MVKENPNWVLHRFHDLYEVLMAKHLTLAFNVYIGHATPLSQWKKRITVKGQHYRTMAWRVHRINTIGVMS